MLPAAITRKTLAAWGGEAVYLQAEHLVKKGAVLKADISGDLITGVIARESGSNVYTKLRLLPNGSIESLCPCFTNRSQGLVCPHVVALGITIMLRRSDPLREQKYMEEQRRARRMSQAGDSAFVRRDPQGQAATLSLTLPPSWVSDFRKGRVNIKLAFKAAGLALKPETLAGFAPLALAPADDNLLSVIEDICEGQPPAELQVSAADFLNILDVSPPGCLSVDNNPLTIGTSPVRTVLRVDLDHDNGELIVYPYTATPSSREGELPTYLVNGRRGCVLSNSHLWPMKDLLPIPYHSIYLQDEIIPRDKVINFLRRDLPTLKSLANVEMEVSPDCFETQPGTPSFLLDLHGTRASLRATLSAVYGQYVFPAGTPDIQSEFALPDPDDILRYQTRNIPAEQAAVAALAGYGFEPCATGYTIVGTREVMNFLGSGQPSLRRSGWKINFSGKLSTLTDSLPVVTPVVKIEPDIRGWFDVGFSFEYLDGRHLPDADIQRALNRGDSFFERDGQTVLVDREAVESMRAVFNDCRSRESKKPGHFMMPEIYAPFVQASLNAIDGIDVEDPPDWRQKAAASNRSGNRQFAPVPLGDLDQVLRPYQKEGVYWLRFIETSGINGLLADEMGLGKTLQTLAWLCLPRSDTATRGQPALIVCPTSLVENWSREAEKFVPHLRRLVINGPDRTALFTQIPDHDLIITSYALLRRDLEAYRPHRFSAAVLDEAQHIKNRSTLNAVSAKQIAAACRLVLTGTPVENSVADIWSIMDFLMPEYLGDYETFRGNYELPIAAGDRQGELAQAKLRRKLHPFILRRLKKHVAKDLPDKIVKVSFCQLTADQQRVYNDLLAESRRKIGDLVNAKGFDRSRFEILAMLMRLRQTCCHLDLLKNRHQPGTYENPSAKLDAFFEILDEAIDGGHRILVFSQFVAMLKLLRDELNNRSVPYCYLDGSTQDRLAQCTRFNRDPSIPVFLISLKAGGTGLNLTGADMVVHFDPWWNPAVEDQATDRAHRIGQKRAVYSIKLIAEHTVEEKVLAMQQKKQAVIDATVGATDAAIMRKMSFNDIRDLLGL
ncbi:MAG: DEAD/DEAH box helicase [Kiritimatiellae bacterium]|nr:DEAD/DEAH box helicase [Kiritimatiellia bacterium]